MTDLAKLEGYIQGQLDASETLPVVLSAADAGYILAAARERDALREALHEIDIEAANTIPPDGKDAAFAALERIIRIINPFRRTTLEKDHG